MADEQWFVFDLKGWLLIRGVMSEEQTSIVREHMLPLREECPEKEIHNMP